VWAHFKHSSNNSFLVQGGREKELSKVMTFNSRCTSHDLLIYSRDQYHMWAVVTIWKIM